MFEEYMLELYHEIEKYKEYEEIIEVMHDIDVIQEMINRYINYGKFYADEVNQIENKYPVETNFLIGLERTLNIGINNNFNQYHDWNLQILKNLRHRLYRIAILKILKLQGKEYNHEVVSKDYKVLINLIKS